MGKRTFFWESMVVRLGTLTSFKTAISNSPSSCFSFLSRLRILDDWARSSLTDATWSQVSLIWVLLLCPRLGLLLELIELLLLIRVRVLVLVLVRRWNQRRTPSTSVPPLPIYSQRLCFAASRFPQHCPLSASPWFLFLSLFFRRFCHQIISSLSLSLYLCGSAGRCDECGGRETCPVAFGRWTGNHANGANNALNQPHFIYSSSLVSFSHLIIIITKNNINYN